MSDEIQRREEIALAKILDDIEAGKIQVYRNVLHQPYMRVMVDQMPPGCFHLYEREAEEWLTDYLWESHEILLRGWEIKPIIAALAGRSMKTVRKELGEPAALHVLQTEPVAAVIYELMYGHPTGRIEKPVEPLWKESREFAKARGLDRFGNKRFPGGANVFSKHLRRLQGALAELGILIELRPENRGLPIVIKRSDDSATESSAESSRPISPSDKELNQKDDELNQLARLRARRRNQTQNDEGRNP